MQLFYSPHIENNRAELPESEARHCIQVLRKQVGDTLHLVDGKGGFFEGVIESAGKKRCVVRIEKALPDPQKRPYQLHIGMAPTKNADRFEWFLEKATEIGIDTITPLIVEHSERRKIRPDRLEKILLSAMKQSLKTTLPELRPLTSLANFLAGDFPENSARFIAHCGAGERLPFLPNIPAGSPVIVLIGPEGDFSEAEVRLANEHGFRSITLGDSRLRTETAGIVACHTVYLANAVLGDSK
ncbi:MAG: 16S rRNA (uracil(1498)-N(3))-methyltransferase [Bacteroidetes bacterium]|nr:MAG: 16S rRNA (uracil(1498)-N(3))-methyltransferase [Bacteroidota bacterium]